MKHITSILRVIYIATLSIALSAYAQTDPIINVCVDDNCKKKANVQISHDTWQSVAEIFSTPFPTDKDEQDNIITAFMLLRTDVYKTLSQNNNLGADLVSLYESNSTESHYKNAKTIIGLLLDNQFIKRHYLRKTLKRSTWSKAFSWSGIINMDSVESDGLLLQSLTDAQQYIFKIESEFAESAVITPFKA